MHIIFPFVCGRCDKGGGGLVFMYEFMHVCMCVCISLYTYVGVHACMCVHVRLADDFINVNTEKNSLFVVKKYLLFIGTLDFYSDYKFYRGSYLICLIRSYVRHCRLTKSVLQIEQKNYVRHLKFGGAKSFLFVIWGGLPPPSPYVEPPLAMGKSRASILMF